MEHCLSIDARSSIISAIILHLGKLIFKVVVRKKKNYGVSLTFGFLANRNDEPRHFILQILGPGPSTAVVLSHSSRQGVFTLKFSFFLNIVSTKRRLCITHYLPFDIYNMYVDSSVRCYVNPRPYTSFQEIPGVNLIISKINCHDMIIFNRTFYILVQTK